MEIFRAKITVNHYKPMEEDAYGKVKSSMIDRSVLSVEVTASSLESLKEKLIAHISLAE